MNNDITKEDLDFAERLDTIISAGNPQSCGTYPTIALLIKMRINEAVRLNKEKTLKELDEAEFERLNLRKCWAIDAWNCALYYERNRSKSTIY